MKIEYHWSPMDVHAFIIWESISFYQFDAWTKSLAFKTFSNIKYFFFKCWKLIIIISLKFHFSTICSLESNLLDEYVRIGSGNGLVQNRQQAINQYLITLPEQMTAKNPWYHGITRPQWVKGWVLVLASFIQSLKQEVTYKYSTAINH